MTSVIMRMVRNSVVVAAVYGACGLAAAAEIVPVPVYDSTQVPFDGYTIVKRLGVEGWRSAFRIPGHSSLEAAKAAITREAAALGADGIINLACFDQTDRIFRPAGYFCYGNAIRLKK